MGKLIDADALIATIHKEEALATVLHTVFHYNEEWALGMTRAATLAIEQPEAVVRCKDCKHSDMEKFDNGEVLLYCNMNRDELGMQRVVHTDHYCGFGERNTRK